MIDINEIRQSIADRKGLIRHRETIISLCDEIDRLRGEKQTPQGKTVRVKVAVAVDKHGYWCANGWKDATPEESRDTASEMVDEGESIYWLTADLPVPEEVEVEAEVENGMS